MAVKNWSDVVIGLNITHLPNTGEAKVAILTSGTDSNFHKYTYNKVDDAVVDFDQNSSVYKLLDAGFNTDDYNGEIEVVVAPSSDVAVSASAATNSASASNSGSAAGSSSANGTTTFTPGNSTPASGTINRFVYALKQVIDDGFNYVVDDNLSQSDKQAVSDYLYATQKAALITQVPDVKTLQAFQAYEEANHPRTNTQLNGVYAIVETSSRKPAIQTAAYAAQYNQSNGAIDLMKIGDLSEFTPDDDLSYEDLVAIKASRGSTIADKADMNMQLTGYALADNYLDNFVNTKIVKDRFQYNLQRALNSLHTNAYDQDTIDYLYTIALNTAATLQQEGFITGSANIQKPQMAQVSSDDIEARYLRTFNIDAEIGSAVETTKVQIDLAE